MNLYKMCISYKRVNLIILKIFMQFVFCWATKLIKIARLIRLTKSVDSFDKASNEQKNVVYIVFFFHTKSGTTDKTEIGLTD